MKRQVDLKATVKTLDGEKEYIFVALTRREAMEVFHGTLTTVLSVLPELGSGDFGALKKLDFDTIWSLAEKLLRFAILDGVEIEDLNETEYFDDHPDELYLAMAQAVRMNWPDIFEKAKNALSGSDLKSKVLEVLNREESTTV
jgi:hypothetical protein